MEAWKIALMAVPILPNLWSIWHAHMHEFPTPLERIFWMYINVFVPVIPGLVYIFYGRTRAVKKRGFFGPSNN